ncbi:ABC transporter [Natronorubrum sediminis]|uniref:ABC transporter n=1 Tax=Natronorubrum sediminis TaxID=640943 RepID=A0A1H6G3A6_9EURY|nr:ABC transporter [Natronorubrum sediminis]
MTAIELRGVTKRYERFGPLRGRSITALHDVDLTVRSGEIFGFLGPNEAGKSTTIDLLLDYAAPTEGTVRVLENDVATESAAIRQRVGVLPNGYGAIASRSLVEVAHRKNRRPVRPARIRRPARPEPPRRSESSGCRRRCSRRF